MTKAELQDALGECTAEVLEQMFFVHAWEGTEPAAIPADSDLICRVDFVGEPSGSLSLRITAGAARSIATGFLGEDEGALSDSQVGQVVCELANIICGSVLSRIESGSTFRLDSPQLLSVWESSSNEEAVVHFVGLDNGVLTIWFAAERPVCPVAA